MPTSLKYASVVLDAAIEKLLDYEIPPGMEDKIEPGMRVSIPLRRQLKKGTVFSIKEKPDFSPVKPISELLSKTAPLTKDLFSLVVWISNYYCAPLHKVIKIALPSSVRSGKKQQEQ